MNIRELLERRANLIENARAIFGAAEAEKRMLTQEEQTRWDQLMDEAAQIKATVERLERQEAEERMLGESYQPGDNEQPGDGGAQPYRFQARSLQVLNEERQSGRPEWRQHLAAYGSREYRSAYASFLVNGSQIRREEMRALQADSDSLGGYLVTPIQMVDRLIMAMDNLVYMRQWATVFPVPNADSLGAVSLDTDPADPTWTSELLIGSEDSSMAFGKREMTPHPLAKYIKVSRKLLRKAPSVEQLVMDRLAYKFSVVMENNYLNGDGAGKPLGVFVASNDGITTSRDVTSGNTQTALGADNLRYVKYTLKAQYRARARWIFHRDAVAKISVLKDGSGNYLWQPGLRAGDPDMVLNMPVAESEYAPNTFTSGLYVGILGDFSNYWIADALDLEMQRLVELYAATNQIGFIGRLESDGMPVLSEAFARCKLA
jgi:HK97 family phage major capsid protein